jgi:MutS domain V/MutS domain III
MRELACAMSARVSVSAVTSAGSALLIHRERVRLLEAQLTRDKLRSNLLSSARLTSFLAAGALYATAARADTPWAWPSAIVLSVAFVGLVVLHAALMRSIERTRLRVHVHARHVARADGSWTAWPNAEQADVDHPYSLDIDLIGQGSLVTRLDVARTQRGHRLLREWLSGPAELTEIQARQQAVAELSALTDVRVELEVSGYQSLRADERLSAEGFVRLMREPSPLRPWQRLAGLALPPITLAALFAKSLGIIAGYGWLIPAALQWALVIGLWSRAWRYFSLIEARRPQLESFARLLAVIERAQFTAPRLVALRSTLRSRGKPPSAHLRALANWAGFSEVRTQIMLHPALNFFLMWDVHVLAGLQRWAARVGRDVDAWLSAVAELEALSSLAALHAIDRDACFPSIVEARRGMNITGLVHPLLTLETRVANDVQLSGPGALMIVTGSNMAGKSTLLRSVGLNVALAMAGGPVCATSLSVPRVRLRASMRATDALQKGASYFYAELAKLKTVVATLDGEPPVMFLLDELLRGTNANARAVGAIAVIRHLLAANALGIVATHDPALNAFADEPGARAINVHFTDVIVDGEMAFDYRLRPGPATTSNALRLLELAGIDRPDDS